MASRQSFPAFAPERFAPTPERPLRAKSRLLEHLADIQPHRHAWAQLVFSMTGAVRVNTEASTYIVPPSRAVWIPPRIVHAVTAIEQADLRTLYLGPDLLAGEAWTVGRVLEVSPLLRELPASSRNDLAFRRRAAGGSRPDAARDAGRCAAAARHRALGAG